MPRKPHSKGQRNTGKKRPSKYTTSKDGAKGTDAKKDRGPRKPLENKKPPKFTKKAKPKIVKKAAGTEGVRLNKFIANAGVCSRREADELIKAGAVKVNGKVVTEMGVKVLPTDKVEYGGQGITSEKPVYLLLNKPKNHITTVSDPKGRRTVMWLVKNACKERIYPVGRLDRDTTGLLLFTNDGDLAKKLTHPKHEVRKVYHATLDKKMTAAHLKQLLEGVHLEDGRAFADHASYVGNDKTQVGLELHSGKNRIVRRMIESMGYKVIKLDRVMFAGLTKKDIPRGKYRFLTQKEVGFLKMI